MGKKVLRKIMKVLRGGCQDTEPCVISNDIRGGVTAIKQCSVTDAGAVTEPGPQGELHKHRSVPQDQEVVSSPRQSHIYSRSIAREVVMRGRNEWTTLWYLNVQCSM
jgi:hypothetical protein